MRARLVQQMLAAAEADLELQARRRERKQRCKFARWSLREVER
jgi:hypothetical protein